MRCKALVAHGVAILHTASNVAVHPPTGIIALPIADRYQLITRFKKS
jgi:hypothetical protein